MCVGEEEREKREERDNFVYGKNVSFYDAYYLPSIYPLPTRTINKSILKQINNFHVIYPHSE